MRFFETEIGSLQRYADVFALIPIGNPLFLVFWLVCYGAIVWLLERRIVQREGLKIQFFITDFWAAILALAPSFFLLADLDDSDELAKWRQIGLFALTFCSTLAGIRTWLILALPARDEPPPGRASHFLSVFSGGIVGLLGVFVTYLAFQAAVYFVMYVPSAIYYTVYSFVGLCIVMPPLALVSAVCFYIFHRTVQNLRR